MSGYNGYKNYATWNVALWISNDEGLYSIASGCSCYNEFIDVMRDLGSLETPDNVAWNDTGIDRDEVEDACFTKEVV
jgi:G3E family GTPase